MKMLIGENFVDASNGKTEEVINPATGKFIDTVPSATKEDVQIAVSNAVEAQVQWAALTVRERTDKILKAASLIKERRLELGKLLSQESGKPYMAEAVWEFDSVAYILEGSCEVAKHHYGKTMPKATEPGYDKDIQFTVHEPLGVIACIIPFNFPPALWSFKVGSALAAGNAVIVKAPTFNPLSIIKLHEILLEVGIPGAVVQCLTGSGSTVGGALTSDPRIASVNFTGSTATGIAIAKSAAENLTQCYFELGGNDALIICDDADMDLAVSEAGDKSRNSGQACTASKRFIVHNSIKDEFVRRLINERLSKLVQGDPMDEKTTMGPMISESAAKNIEAQVNLTISQGAKVAFGGKRNGAFFEPTVLTDVTPEMDIARDMEVFGPVWPVIGFDCIEEAIAIGNNTSYGLGGGVITRDMKKAFKVANELKTGHVAINASGGFRAAELPFGGGKKASGNSRESLSAAMSEVTQTKSIILRYILD
ncbi:succinate-semialdehyde dehydrogenase [Salmonella enterica subsp. enterica serovar Namur str. 05-2929]|uniref:Aldehyde dehydrogenase n=2 Tax=Salmonella enterica I TaxID=59201 RepID=A0A5W7RZM9_SALET|nr:aldehyde dehydrogenase family protein [Salmonella enterica]EAA7108156.1 aldehyde dehydrogenase [Salmonella enterica subsp. enterica serovar Ouagadougou]EBF8311749.1 aldehyde dehydrogenase [Salmonella enterica subsp. enterica serovar Tamberma]EBP8881014.1 aldehyde dehydrogenase [Salmonella enterica subsp. enterica]EBQ9804158.1 aldehyde dehydrogenase [Salmonella enterica subsp. enterica serovar Rissen]EBR8059679.1 aldehyde dehydrogenase [Salmonella enterica subsp. enterica serovar Soerenga]E